MESHKYNIPELPHSLIIRPIKEWFRFFLQIVNDEQMLGKLERSLKVAIPKDGVEGGKISAKLSERHTIRVWRNMKII